MSNVQIPEGLRALVTEAKDAVYAEKLVTHYQPTFERCLAYELISGPPLAFGPFLAAVITDVAKNQKLGEAIRASPGSFIAALQHCAQLKLLPGNIHGLFHLIPRMNRGVLEVNPMIGYRGLCVISQRHKRVHSVEAFLVYKGEVFEFDAGAGKLKHLVDWSVDRSEGSIVGGYMRAIITEEVSNHAVTDSPIIWPMSRDEILKRRASSDAYKRAEANGRKDSPWHLWPDMMWRKTVLIGGLNHGSVPRDLGVGGALTADQEADSREDKPLPAPSVTQGAGIRATLGLDKPAKRFEMVEDALQAIAAAKSVVELEALAAGWQHFEGVDTETIANAYADREQEILA